MNQTAALTNWVVRGSVHRRFGSARSVWQLALPIRRARSEFHGLPRLWLRRLPKIRFAQALPARAAPALAVGGRLRAREKARSCNSHGGAATTDAGGRHMSGAPMRRWWRHLRGSTFIDVAARNRCARFPAGAAGRVAPTASAGQRQRSAGVGVCFAAVQRSAGRGSLSVRAASAVTACAKRIS